MYFVLKVKEYTIVCKVFTVQWIVLISVFFCKNWDLEFDIIAAKNGISYSPIVVNRDRCEKLCSLFCCETNTDHIYNFSMRISYLKRGKNISKSETSAEVMIALSSAL